jgi:Asp-tRNA(Asn)/Glu-tRNA(Gln) amidotransferase A subunit family amidase
MQVVFANHTIAELRSTGLSSVDLVRRSLSCIAELDPALNAFVTVDDAGALAAAHQLDAERAGGSDRGPLHGVPVAVKDIIDVAGLPTTMGSAHFAGYVADRDAECVRRLRAAGAIVIGKTTTHEFAYGPTGDRSANGPARNPCNPARISGGSSGGSAVAVAAGMVPLAVGTDTGGSVRIPAALCGVVGFKPAYGAIPTDGVFPLAESLDHVGVLARTADDCLLAYRVLADRPSVAPVQPTEPLRIARLRLGSPHDVDDAVQELCDVRVGDHDVVETSHGAEACRAFLVVQQAEASAVHADRMATAPELFDPEVLDRLRDASEVPAWRYVRAQRIREQAHAEVSRLLERYDMFTLPTVPVVAPRLDQREVTINGRNVSVRGALLSLTSVWNLLGLPAVTVPAGTVDGLPVGAQLVGRTGSEEALLSTADRLRVPC